MWRYFPDREFARISSDPAKMAPDFMEKMVALREALNAPMRINSAYRSPEFNSRVSTSGFDGPHTTGRAIDIGIAGEDAYNLVRLAMNMGFTGIGVKQKGAWNGRFIHLDDLPSTETRQRPTLWGY